jgi:hypothetical protein
VSILAPYHHVASGDGSDAALKLMREGVGVGKLMVGVMCVLPLCDVVLVLPAIAVAQPAAPSGLYVNTSDSYGLLLGWLHNSFDESERVLKIMVCSSPSASP